MTTDPTEAERLARISGEIFDAVLDSGFLVHYVPADAASVIHQNQPYAYTVGRTLMERPEFLVTGLGQDESKALLAAVVEWDDLRGADQLAGCFLNLRVDGKPMKVKLILADSGPLLGALTAFGLDKVQTVQALWPRAGGYPDVNDRWSEQPIHPYGETPLQRGPDPYRD